MSPADDWASQRYSLFMVRFDYLFLIHTIYCSTIFWWEIMRGNEIWDCKISRREIIWDRLHCGEIIWSKKSYRAMIYQIIWFIAKKWLRNHKSKLGLIHCTILNDQLDSVFYHVMNGAFCKVRCKNWSDSNSLVKHKYYIFSIAECFNEFDKLIKHTSS